MQSTIHIYKTPEKRMASNTYHIIDTINQSHFIIDPSQYPTDLSYASFPVTHVCLTHAHFDHIRILEEFNHSNIPIYGHAHSKDMINNPTYNCSSLFGYPTHFSLPTHFLNDQDEIMINAHAHLKIYHTPGHTPDSITYLLIEHNQPICLFTGDFLFMQTIGRTDLPKGNYIAMLQSLSYFKNFTKDFPPETKIYAGHGPSTTLGQENKTNPYLIK